MATDSDNLPARPTPIQYTPETGDLAGTLLTGGKPCYRPQGAPLDTYVRFDPVEHNGRKQPAYAGVSRHPGLQPLIDRYRAEQDARNAAIEAAAEQVQPIGYVYRHGCDAADTHEVVYADDVPCEVIAAAASPVPAIRQCLTSDDLDRIAEQTGAVNLDATLASYYGWQYDAVGLAALRGLADARKPEMDRRAAAQRAKNRRENAEMDAKRQRNGLCPHCGTYCYGDCRANLE